MSHPERAGDYLERMAEAVARAIKYADGVGSLEALDGCRLGHYPDRLSAAIATDSVLAEISLKEVRCSPFLRSSHASR